MLNKKIATIMIRSQLKLITIVIMLLLGTTMALGATTNGGSRITDIQITENPNLGDFWAGKAYFERQSYVTPNVVHEDSAIAMGNNTIYMYYRTYVGQSSNGGAIGLAISRDGGSSFSLYNGGVPVVNTGTGCDPDSQYAVSPSVVRVKGFYMVYEGYSQCGFPGDIMLATSSDGLNWIKRGQIITHDEGFESTNIGTPFIGWFNVSGISQFYVFYHGYNWWTSNSHVGYASGTNIFNLVKNPNNPVMDVGKGIYSWDANVNSHVSIVKEGGWYYMAYEGSQDVYCDGGNWGWGMARSQDLNNWEKYNFNPIRHTYAGGCGNDLPDLFVYKGNSYVYQREPGQRNILTWGQDPYLTVWRGVIRCYTYHQVGREDNGGWSANTGQDGIGYLCYGPYVELNNGSNNGSMENYDVTFVEEEDINSGFPDIVTTQDIYDDTTGSIVKLNDIFRFDFVQDMLYQGFNYQFPASMRHQYEFRTYWHDKAYIRQIYTYARRLS